MAGPVAGGGPRILALFLSNGGSLTRWRKEAILSREILLYLHFLREGVFDRVQIFSYDARDHALLRELAATDAIYARIDLLTPPKGALFGPKAALWSLQGVRRHRRALSRAGWIKTNQASGAWAAVYASRLTGARLLFRMGYILSRRFALNGQPLRAKMAARVEDVGFRAASHILVTAEAAAEALQARPAAAGKVQLSPTYVDVSLFRPKDRYSFDGPAFWVGRYTPQKNVLNMVRACQSIALPLRVAGRGDQEAEMRAIAEAEGKAPLTFEGLVPNDALAEMMRAHDIFLLPSLHEGLPKVLIEAMACGMICVASRIPGVTDLIEDGVSGYLIDGFAAEDIAATLRRALAERNPAIGRAARAVVEDKFSLARYAAREAALYA